MNTQERTEELELVKYEWIFHEVWFSVEEMYRFVETFAEENNLVQTQAALPFMKQSHAGQWRKGSCWNISLGVY